MTDISAYFEGLYRMTELVASVARGELSYGDFAQQYDSYYWVAALDGHEGGPVHERLETNGELISLHAAAQAILDSVYLGLGEQAPAHSGRISTTDAETKLRELGKRHDIGLVTAQAHRLRQMGR